LLEKVFLEDNVKSLGAKVFVIKDDGSELVRVRISGNGLLTDGSSEMFFGLGDYENLVDVRVEFLSGEKMFFENILHLLHFDNKVFFFYKPFQH